MNETNAKVAAAIKEIDSLCKGKRWHMSIPVQDTDSDVVISSAIMSLTIANDEQQATIDRLEKEKQELIEVIKVSNMAIHYHTYQAAKKVAEEQAKG
jgi:hypothetical protein